jgi:geranylgeranyl diphosphate synthase type I
VSWEGELVARVEAQMLAVIERAERGGLLNGGGLPLYRVLGYHLGWVDAELRPARADGGKRVRPLLCLLCCEAAGGEPLAAVPVAAAIELLHNFTLIHDDIQDRSRTRRHRPTVWALWGDAQAINAGDAMFALSQLALLDLADQLPPSRLVALARVFNETTLRIVEGQVLDLGFEKRSSVDVGEYLIMIRGKTAALTAFAAWAGALVAAAEPARLEQFRRFGEALGLGFQLQDDYLGIWGRREETGKEPADDIRRRKKSLPIVLLLETASPADRLRLEELWSQPEVDEDAVAQVLELLERYRIRERVQTEVVRLHREARDLLETAAAPGRARDALATLVGRLARRSI